MLFDFRYGLRKLASTPGFTLLAVLALALGIAANTSIFTVVNAVLLRPLPFLNPDRLTYIWEVSPRTGNATNSANPGNFLEWRDRNRSFERLAAWVASPVNLTGDGEPEQVRSAYVTADFLPVLGISPALGRNFSAEECQPNGPDALILSHALWVRRFGSNAAIIGRRVQVNGKESTVVGVAPPGFDYPRRSELWEPIAPKRAWEGRYLTVIARMQPAATRESAQRDMEAIMAQLRTEHPEFNSKWGVNVTPMKDYEVRELRVALLALLGAVGFVLLIACANVANLMLVRATGRTREMAVRASIGASRWDLVRPLLIESLTLAFAAGAVGLLLSAWLTDLLLAMAPESLSIAEFSRIGLDVRVLAFTFAASLATGVIFGLVPAIRVSRVQLSETLRGSRAPNAGMSRNGLRSALVIAEVALSLILLIGAGLLGRSFLHLLAVQPGFEPDHTLTLNLAIFNRPGPQSSAFLDSVLERVRSIPGVRAAGSAHVLPLSGMLSATGFRIAGLPAPTPGDEPVCEVFVITPGYFAAMGMPLLQGRGFESRDHQSAPPVLVISQSLARRYFPGQNPVGRRLHVQWDHPDIPYEIIGVAGDIHSTALNKEPNPAVYIHNAQEPLNGAHLVIRTSSDPMQIAGTIRRQIRSLDPSIPVSNMRSLDFYRYSSVSMQRFSAILAAAFASLALTLAALGVFGVISYMVSQRTQEIGIRMALGARRSDVGRLIVGEGMLLAGVGIVAGIIGALAVTRYLSTLLFGVTPTDVATFAGVSGVLALTALAAAWLPARRAANVDPMVALRNE